MRLLRRKRQLTFVPTLSHASAIEGLITTTLSWLSSLTTYWTNVPSKVIFFHPVHKSILLFHGAQLNGENLGMNTPSLYLKRQHVPLQERIEV
jgi:hypothetical protein